MNRVVITGIGVVTPIGNTRDAFWSALVEARSGIGPVTLIPTERLNIRIAAQVLDFKPAEHFDPRRESLLDRFAQFAVVAARSALRDSQLELTEEIALDAATIIGNSTGGMNTLDDSFLKLYGQNATRAHPLSIPRLMSNAACSAVSMDLGLKGPTYTIASACSSGTHAIGQAFQMVRTGQSPIALTGGTEACLTVGTFKGWEALRVLSSDTCRPFSRTRSGLVLGEGAAMFVLETRDHAIARGAPIYAEILGFGMSADAGDITAIDPSGAARAMRAALKDGKINSDDVDYVNAHGTGTKANDEIETAAIRRVFGAHADRLSVSSTKSMHAHCMGASGGLEMIACVMAIREGLVPPTANYREKDAACDLDVTPNVARQREVRAAISNGFAFGGTNAVLAFKAV